MSRSKAARWIVPIPSCRTWWPAHSACRGKIRSRSPTAPPAASRRRRACSAGPPRRRSERWLSEGQAACRLSDIEGAGGEKLHVGVPVLRDIEPRRHPDALVPYDVVEEAHQGRRAAGPSDQAAVQADRHHLRRRCPFSIKHVKTVLQISEEFLAPAKALRVDEAHVVGI